MSTHPLAKQLRHYLQFTDLTAEEYAHVFKRAAFIKAKFKNYPEVLTALKKITNQLDSTPVNSVYSALIIPHFPKCPEVLSLRNILLDW
jgi:hypothetical protein